MRRHRPLIVALVLLALIGVGAYAAWAILAASGLGSAWPYLMAGVATVGVVIAGFLRLAFHSNSHGYDDRADINRR
jgi:hypothetical protein